MEVEVEEECLKILALHQPVAQDLRYIVAILKINRVLERVGDHAASIAKSARALKGKSVPEWPAEMEEMAEQARHMMRKAFASVIALDVDLAREVWNADDSVDELTGTVMRLLRDRLNEQDSRREAVMRAVTVVNLIERIADNAANVAKDVLYCVLGEIVRHRGREFKHPPQAVQES
ncbi:MAG: phosphate signaling complex protein PhoU, partial [Kiritimatiellia bacterium]|nr:phosphate signaling complex protein PhoU [Kiritimatiellia bacterium]